MEWLLNGYSSSRPAGFSFDWGDSETDGDESIAVEEAPNSVSGFIGLQFFCAEYSGVSMLAVHVFQIEVVAVNKAPEVIDIADCTLVLGDTEVVTVVVSDENVEDVLTLEVW